MIIIEVWEHPTVSVYVIRDTISNVFSALEIESDEWHELCKMGGDYNKQRLQEIASMELCQDYDGKKWSNHDKPLYEIEVN